MGSWRKVGAFLGLVPDDGRRDEFGEEYDEHDYQDDDRTTPTRPPARYAADDYGPDEYQRDDPGYEPRPRRGVADTSR